MTKDEALKLALEALEAVAIEGDVACVVKPDGAIYLRPAITAIKEALAQPEREPVAYIDVEQRRLQWAKPMSWNTPTTVNLPKIPLYTAPPQPEERNFCPRCGKRIADPTTIHTCTPPQIDPNNRGFPWTQKHNPAPQLFAAMPSNILPPLRTKEDGIDPNQWAFDNGLEST